jgi:subtilisin family serine protease
MHEFRAFPSSEHLGHLSVVVVIGALATAGLGCWSCAPTQVDTSAALPWDLKAIGAADAWKVTQGEGELIAILDSGLTDDALPGLRSREVAPLPPADPIGHGTAVTTLAAGSGDLGVWGVAPRARLLSISVIDAAGQIESAAVAAGIRAAVDHGASVINMSFGKESDSPQIKSMIDYATSRGVVVVAAGGDTASPTPLFPADVVSEVIAVRALAENGQPPLSANTVGSNGIDAPGENLPAVTLDNGRTVVAGSDGSSMAAALVTGSVALLEACTHRKFGSVLSQTLVLRALRQSERLGPWFNLRAALRVVGC